MLTKPTKVNINGIDFKFNTDFRIAIKCNDLIMDNSIGDTERTMAIIYLLYGDLGLEHLELTNELIDNALWFISCGKTQEQLEQTKGKREEADMDYTQDMDYIEASFLSDYGIDLEHTKMHWWKFYNLINGLSNSEMGNCCILNRIRNIRNYNLNDIKDSKEKQKMREAKEMFKLKKRDNKKELTEEQQHNIQEFYKLIGKGE